MLQELTSGPLGPWISFALAAGPAAAILVFIFVILLALLLSLLLFCAGDPEKMLGAVLLVGPVAGLHAAVHVGAFVMLFGWPALSIIERIFHLSPQLESWVASWLTLSYASVGLVFAAALTIVIVVMFLGIWKEQRKVLSAWEQKQRRWRESNDQRSRSTTAKEERADEKEDLPLGEQYRRAGRIIGLLFFICMAVAGLFVTTREHSFLPLIFLGTVGIVVFFLSYGINQLLGSVLERVVSDLQGRGINGAGFR
jgi:hypothetical protein